MEVATSTDAFSLNQRGFKLREYDVMTGMYLPYHKAIEQARINAQRDEGSGGGDRGGSDRVDKGGRGGVGSGYGGGDDDGDDGGGSGGGGGGGGRGYGGGDGSKGGGTRDVGQQTDPTIGEYGMSLLLYGVAITTVAAPFISRIMSARKHNS